MRILRLKIHNIASIADADIDFQNGPLGQEPVFLITGPTGSGKTTVLDCISLVLFDKTPRLDNALPESFNDGKAGNISIGDQRMLMRRGTGEALIELAFSAGDDTYTAIWECHRAGKKPEWAFQPRTREIRDAGGTAICSRLTDVSEFVTRKIGMTYDQFCKTTMLAQGEFTKFLKSSENDKSSILERLTGTDTYSKISIAIQKITAHKSQKLKEMNTLLGNFRLLTPEELAERQERTEALTRECETLNSEIARTEDKITWLGRFHEAEENAAKLEKEYDGVAETINTEIFKERQDTLSEWDKSTDARTAFAAKKEKSRQLDGLEGQKAGLSMEYSRCLAGLDRLENESRQKQSELEQKNDLLASLKTSEDTFDNITLISGLFKDISQLEADTARLNMTKTALVQKAETLEANVADTRNAYNIALEKDTMSQGSLEAAKKRLAEMNPRECNRAYTNILNELENAKDLKNLFQAHEQAVGAVAENDCKTASCETAIREKTAAVDALGIDRLEEKVRTLQATYDKCRMTCEDIVKEYRHSLSVGDQCPVCGRTVTEELSDARFESALEPVRDMLDKAVAEKEDAVNRKNELISTFIVPARNLLKECTDRKPGLAAAERAAREQLEACPGYPDYAGKEHPAEEVGQAIAQLNVRKNETAAKVELCGEQQKTVDRLQQEKDRSAQIAVKTKESYEDAVRRQEKNLRDITETEKAGQEKTEEIARKLTRLDTLIHTADWQRLWAADKQAFVKSLEDEASRYRSLKNDIILLERTVEQQNGLRRTVRDIHSQIAGNDIAWLEHTATAPVPCKDLQQAWMTLNTRLNTFTTSYSQTRKELGILSENLAEYHATEASLSPERLEALTHFTPDRIGHIRQAVNETVMQEASVKAQIRAAGNTLKALSASKPAMEEGEDMESLREKKNQLASQVDEFNRNIGSIRQEIRQNTENTTRFRNELKTKETMEQDFGEWSRLNEMFGSADGKAFRKIAQSYVLGNLIECANIHLRQLSTRYELACSPGSLTILLKDLNAGNTLRPTSTLSGGESFLVSLSLALGLSSLTGSTGSSDILFIDEGFGTLDSDYLSTVLNALEQLHQAKGQKVGIISHVDALKERIGTQIRIARQNPTTSTVKVSCEV